MFNGQIVSHYSLLERAPLPEFGAELSQWRGTHEPHGSLWGRLVAGVMRFPAIEAHSSSKYPADRAMTFPVGLVLRDPATSLAGPDQVIEPVRIGGSMFGSAGLCLPAERVREAVAQGWGYPLQGRENWLSVKQPAQPSQVDAIVGLCWESYYWSQAVNAPDQVRSSRSGISTVVVFDGTVGVDFAGTQLRSGPVGRERRTTDAFAGQANMLCGGGSAGSLVLKTALYRGPANFRVVVAERAPDLDPLWEDVVEVDFVPTTPVVGLENWDGYAVVNFHLDPGRYRARYAARGLDDRDRDPGPTGEGWPFDHYELTFWPVSHATDDRVVRETSQYAARENARR